MFFFSFCNFFKNKTFIFKPDIFVNDKPMESVNA